MADAASGAQRLRVLILLGSVRRERQGIGVARFVAARLHARGIDSEIADPAEIDLLFIDRMYKEYPPGEAPQPMEALARMIRRADAVVAVSAEYNHGIPPALKNMIDHYLEEWFFKPSGIVSYSAGRFGGVRAAMQLRMILAEVGMPTVSSILAVPSVARAVSAEGEDLTNRLSGAAERFFDDLLWWAEAARVHRGRAGTPF